MEVRAAARRAARRRARASLAVFALAITSLGPLSPAAYAAGGSRPSPGTADEERDRFDVVVIDAGHGGEDTGARGHGGLAEKDVVLDVSRRLAERLRARGLTVVLTRDGDEFVPLEQRTAIANDARGDLFLSIHANASRSASPRGVESYFVSLEASDADASRVAELENEALGATAPAAAAAIDPLSAILGDLMSNLATEESSDFAKLAQRELAAIDDGGSRGVKQAPFVVLMGVHMPACLVEIGFLTNRDDETALRTERRRGAIVRGLERAVDEFGQRYDARRGEVARTAPGAGAGR